MAKAHRTNKTVYRIYIAYVLQGKVFYTVVLPLFDLATVSRPQKPSALDLSTFYFTSALGMAKAHRTNKTVYRIYIAYVLQGKVFYTVVLPLFDLATVSRPQKPSALDLSTFYFTSALGIAQAHGTGKAHYRSLTILHSVQKNPARKDRIFAYGVSFCFL